VSKLLSVSRAAVFAFLAQSPCYHHLIFLAILSSAIVQSLLRAGALHIPTRASSDSASRALGLSSFSSEHSLNRDKTFHPPVQSWLQWRTQNNDNIDDLDSEKAIPFILARARRSPPPSRRSTWRQRDLYFFSLTTTINTPNIHPFRDTLPSRILRKFPYVVENVQWALIYSVYQMGRGFLAKHLKSRTVNVAR
jgi:hypothetical protein